jgi:hypothetical protein
MSTALLWENPILGVSARNHNPARESVAWNEGAFYLAIVIGVNDEIVSHEALRLNVYTL